MTFFRTPLGVALAAVLILLLGSATVVTARVSGLLHPDRETLPEIDLDVVLVGAEEVEFPARDRVRLRGWMLGGASAMPPIALCHDRTASRTALATLGQALHARGFPVLLFDFRVHGTSEGLRSTLGLDEKHDVLGAVDFLLRGRPSQPLARVGVYGVGMGAHAAVLAAADRREIAALALDGLYPDVGWPLARDAFGEWRFGIDHLAGLPRAAYALLVRTSPLRERASDVLAQLEGRDVLLLAPAGNSALALEIERMHASIPEHPDGDTNLVVVPATRSDGLYGADLGRYEAHVVEFFERRLLRAETLAVAAQR